MDLVLILEVEMYLSMDMLFNECQLASQKNWVQILLVQGTLDWVLLGDQEGLIQTVVAWELLDLAVTICLLVHSFIPHN